jgi:hypothetical protein
VIANSPPLRFLMLVLAAWTGGRATVLAGWWEGSEAKEQAKVEQVTELRSSRAKSRGAGTDSVPLALAPVRKLELRPSNSLGTNGHLRQAMAVAAPAPAAPERAPPPPRAQESWSLQPFTSLARSALPLPTRSPPTPSPKALPTRWAFSAWAFLRRGEAPGLVPGDMLGGSQAGARVTHRLGGGAAHPLQLSARASMPVNRRSGAEAALGLDWRPLKTLPLHLLAERRQALGREGRSAFSLTAYGGVSEGRLGPLRIDAYAQAGVVGAGSRDLFADGSVRLSLPLDGEGRLKLGAGAWAAAQPGVSRVDLGPQASLRLPLAGRSVTASLDWRLRVAGDARPRSGPALTLASDF